MRQELQYNPALPFPIRVEPSRVSTTLPCPVPRMPYRPLPLTVESTTARGVASIRCRPLPVLSEIDEPDTLTLTEMSTLVIAVPGLPSTTESTTSRSGEAAVSPMAITLPASVFDVPVTVTPSSVTRPSLKIPEPTRFTPVFAPPVRVTSPRASEPDSCDLRMTPASSQVCAIVAPLPCTTRSPVPLSSSAPATQSLNA